MNFDITSRWRGKYENHIAVESSRTLLREHPFDGVVGFKAAMVKEKHRFARAFTGHLLRFALAKNRRPLTVQLVERTTKILDLEFTV